MKARRTGFMLHIGMQLAKRETQIVLVARMADEESARDLSRNRRLKSELHTWAALANTFTA